MRLDDAVLYEEVVHAREEAVELMDRYRDSPADTPHRDQLWDRVVVQTETARGLLESWLERQPPDDHDKQAGSRAAFATANRTRKALR